MLKRQIKSKRKKTYYMILGWIIAFTLCVITTTGIAFADGEHNDILDDREPFFSAEKKSELENALKGADFADHLMAGWMVQLMNAVELHSVESLVFGTPGGVWWDQRTYGRMLYGTFHEREVSQILEPAVQLFLMLFAVGLCGAILYSTLKIGANPHNPYTKYEFAENVKSWFISGVFFASYPTILDLIFALNESIRMTFYDWMGHQFALSYLSETTIRSERAFGAITLAFVEFIIVLYLNFIYLARKFILMLLIVIGPVMGILLFFTRLRPIVGRWFKEMISNTFIQSIHAILLFIMASSSGFTHAGSFAKLAWLFLLIPVSGMLSEWMGKGESESRTEKRLNLAGLGSISGLTALTRESISVWQKQRQNMNPSNHDGFEQWGDASLFDHGGYDPWDTRRVRSTVSGSHFVLTDKSEKRRAKMNQRASPTNLIIYTPDSAISGSSSAEDYDKFSRSTKIIDINERNRRSGPFKLL
jgi:hypothetical protein